MKNSESKPKSKIGEYVKTYTPAIILPIALITVMGLSYEYFVAKDSAHYRLSNLDLFKQLKQFNQQDSTPLDLDNTAAVAKSFDRVLYAHVTRGLDKKIPAPNSTIDLIVNDKQSKTISIGWVGDIIPVISNPAPVSGDTANIEANKYFGDFLNIFKSLDIMSGNLEGVLSDSEDYQSKCAKMKTNCFAIKGSSSFAQTLKASGFDVLNIANNHALDYGSIGLTDTQINLNISEIEHTGAKGKIAYIETEKGKVAFVGFAQNYLLNSLTDKSQIQSLIKVAKENADIVIATIHAGAEGPTQLFVPDGPEVYLNENRGNTKDIAHTLIDSGADMVLGSGPHVMRGIEIYNQKIIAYSLGNFLSVNKLSKNNFLALSGVLIININSNKELDSVKLVPVRISSPEGIPKFDESGASILLVNHLSKENFGENGLILDENGEYKF